MAKKKKKKGTRRPEASVAVAPLLIREMELDDLPAVYRLGERLFTAEKQPTLYRTWDEYELVELFKSDGDFCLVAERRGRVLGFAMGTLIEKRGRAWKYGWLIWLGVTPRYGGKGLGTRLVERLTERFMEQGARIMITDTQRSNVEALRFFNRKGFGQETQHVYLSKNLTTHPRYRKGKKKNDSFS